MARRGDNVTTQPHPPPHASLPGMEWRDRGIIIGARRHGETSLILEVMTRDHGRHLGLVKGGRSRRMQPLLQPGNAVEVTWRARLEEHLGFYVVETTGLRAAELMARPASLHGLNLVTVLLRLLAEREPHERLFELAVEVIAALDEAERAPALLVRLELALLAESGFGLDLESCAATGRRDDLVYVSPRSARAVSREAGAPYRDKLLPLPDFLRDDMPAALGAEHITPGDVAAGFALTGYFLQRDLFGPRGLALPAARDAYLAQLRPIEVPVD